MSIAHHMPGSEIVPLSSLTQIKKIDLITSQPRESVNNQRANMTRACVETMVYYSVENLEAKSGVHFIARTDYFKLTDKATKKEDKWKMDGFYWLKRVVVVDYKGGNDAE